MLCNQGALVEFGYISITKSLALSLMSLSMSFVRKKCTMSKSKQTPSDFNKLKKLSMNNMWLRWNLKIFLQNQSWISDQTGIKIVLSSGWTLASQGYRRVEVLGANDKLNFRSQAVQWFVTSFQYIYGGVTDRCHPNFQFPSDRNTTGACGIRPKHFSFLMYRNFLACYLHIAVREMMFWGIKSINEYEKC